MAELAIKFLVLETVSTHHRLVEEESSRHDTYEQAEQEISKKIDQMDAGLLGPAPSYSIKKIYTAKQ